MSTIALLGLGNMGKGISLSILRSGRQLIIWNRTAGRASHLLTAGAIWAETPAAAASQADVVIAVVADDVASAEVWLGKNGAMQAMKPGAFMIECSTLSLGHVLKLSAAASQQGLLYIDCPVTGIPDAAAAGELKLLVGSSIENLATCTELLQSFSNKIYHFGKIGTGTSYKLMINLMGAVQIAALAEGIALAQTLGLDAETVINAIETSAAASPQVIRYTRKMGENTYSDQPAFTTGLRHKDANYAVQMAKAIGANIKLGIVANDLFEAAASKNAADDEAKVIELMI